MLGGKGSLKRPRSSGLAVVGRWLACPSGIHSFMHAINECCAASCGSAAVNSKSRIPVNPVFCYMVNGNPARCSDMCSQVEDVYVTLSLHDGGHGFALMTPQASIRSIVTAACITSMTLIIAEGSALAYWSLTLHGTLWFTQDAVDVWARTFAALGINYHGSTMTLDLWQHMTLMQVPGHAKEGWCTVIERASTQTVSMLSCRSFACTQAIDPALDCQQIFQKGEGEKDLFLPAMVAIVIEEKQQCWKMGSGDVVISMGASSVGDHFTFRRGLSTKGHVPGKPGKQQVQVVQEA
eukprot:scaffold212786_cov17-Tisochrysis_lutea.AAC.1